MTKEIVWKEVWLLSWTCLHHLRDIQGGGFVFVYSKAWQGCDYADNRVEEVEYHESTNNFRISLKYRGWCNFEDVTRCILPLLFFVFCFEWLSHNNASCSRSPRKVFPWTSAEFIQRGKRWKIPPTSFLLYPAHHVKFFSSVYSAWWIVERQRILYVLKQIPYDFRSIGDVW